MTTPGELIDTALSERFETFLQWEWKSEDLAAFHKDLEALYMGLFTLAKTHKTTEKFRCLKKLSCVLQTHVERVTKLHGRTNVLWMKLIQLVQQEMVSVALSTLPVQPTAPAAEANAANTAAAPTPAMEVDKETAPAADGWKKDAMGVETFEVDA